MSSSDYTRGAGGEALAARLRRLSERLDRDGSRVYAAEGVAFEQRWYGVLNQLILNGPMSIGDLAGALRITHVSVSQASRSMEKAGIISSAPDPADARRRQLRLTEQGQILVDRLEPLWRAFNQAAGELNAEAGNAVATLDRLDDALAGKSMFDRIMDQIAADKG